MPRPLKRRPYDVHLTDHGWKRFCERAGPYRGISRKKLTQRLHAKINNALGPGITFAYCDAARVEVFPCLCAVVTVGDGRLDVVTFKYDLEEENEATG